MQHSLLLETLQNVQVGCRLHGIAIVVVSFAVPLQLGLFRLNNQENLEALCQQKGHLPQNLLIASFP